MRGVHPGGINCTARVRKIVAKSCFPLVFDGLNYSELFVLLLFVPAYFYEKDNTERKNRRLKS